MSVVFCLWYVAKKGSKLRLKIPSNIEEQPVDVKGLVGLL
jgi:hypothetical protein